MRELNRFGKHFDLGEELKIVEEDGLSVSKKTINFMRFLLAKKSNNIFNSEDKNQIYFYCRFSLGINGQTLCLLTKPFFKVF